MIFIKKTITYFFLKSKIYLKNVPIMTNNTLVPTNVLLTSILLYSNIYNLYKHSSHKTCE